MKKSGTLFVLISMIFAIFLVGIVSAAASPIAESLNSIINSIIDVLKPLLQAIVGDISAVGGISSDGIFLAKVVVLIMLFALVYDVLNFAKILKSSWVIWTISIVVPILGVRFISPAMIAAIAVPNTALTVAIVAGLPFVLYFLAVQRFYSQTVRRIAWIFFGVVFLFIWAANAANIYSWIYVLAAIGAFIMIVLDGTWQRLKKRIEAEKKMTAAQHRHYLRMVAETEKREEEYSTALRLPADTPNRSDRIERAKQELEAARDAEIAAQNV